MNSFLQSAEWEKFQNLAGRKTWRAKETLLIRHNLTWGLNYLYCPRPENLSFGEEAQKISLLENSIFLKIDPSENLNTSVLKGVKFRISNHLQPAQTLWVDLKKTEGELLSQMHEKTRYNIRLAERSGVLVASAGDVETFWKLLGETAKRDLFSTHEKSYYQKLVEAKSSEFSNELFFAKYKGTIIAAALINFYTPARTATYLHGASSRTHREVMAPQLLHWKIMLEAKQRGLSFYDWGGIDKVKWPGVTRFKNGFGGSVFKYPDAIDIIYRPVWYFLYQMSRNFRGK